ncbi:type II toxin-antitoxin system HicA family toxin [Candidatus Acetothermia bacterium]|jgi:predicted RNA binding protein YcfA (HicA-like mRNA interferase family)|nr:type II toxin-antitoxin system HicA family toxin [Candidatus Acetothermia bacterium]MCI2432181.1 type II toxin-antitoxin system HicA family toxin [Candidatus Acetothermia bacterium]
MTQKLPALSGREVIKALTKVGFVLKRVTGSHYMMFNPSTQKTVPVPYHKTVKPGVLLSIIKQAGLSRDEFLKLL